MQNQKGILFGSVAFFLWGILPIYWHLVSFTTAEEILCHRIVWSSLFLGIIILLRKDLKSLSSIFTRQALLINFASAILIGANWLTFVWAVGSGHALEAGIGYFISPLLTASLGVVFLKERITKRQILTFCSASCGIFTLGFGLGKIPWVSLALAGSWSFYSLIKKGSKRDSVLSLTVESFLLLPIALLYLYLQDTKALSIIEQLLLFGTGPITVLPLLLFGAAVKCISLVNLGKIQYLNPSMQIVVSVFVFGESFATVQAIALGGILLGVLIEFQPKRYESHT
jgi:chloramphenicol-sensitive protein RarD